jgi:Ca2+-binding EF-hand superfamily protein
VLGQADIDEKRYLNYRKFVFKVKEMISNLYSVEALSEAAEKIKAEKVTEDDVKQTYISNLDLFKLFKTYDKNMNGYLELDEYMLCLKDQGLDLSKQEIVALSMVADTNGDGKIDYEEFMKHIRDVLDMVRFQTLVNEQTAEIMEARREERIKKAKEEEEKRHQDDL